jgi:nitroreductase
VHFWVVRSKNRLERDNDIENACSAARSTAGSGACSGVSRFWDRPRHLRFILKMSVSRPLKSTPSNPDNSNLQAVDRMPPLCPRCVWWGIWGNHTRNPAEWHMLAAPYMFMGWVWCSASRLSDFLHLLYFGHQASHAGL